AGIAPAPLHCHASRVRALRLGNSSLTCTRLAYGIWRIAGARDDGRSPAAVLATARSALISAYEAGYTLFDGADIYGGEGRAEELFGKVLREVSGMRERILVTSKCGVRHAGAPNPDSPQRWDFSPDYIVRSCEGSLKRLGVETIDLYLLH